MSEGVLAGTVALVTGGSRGLGAATAVALAQRGAHVVLIARTVGGLEATDDAVRAVGGSATLLPLDLAKLDQLDALGPTLFERFGRLDGFIGCAAELGTLSPVAHAEPKKFDGAMTVNLTANQRLVRTLDPLLRAAPAGRAVFVTDRVGYVPTAYWGGYAVSKAALELMARAWAEETRTTNLRVNLFDPGPMSTALRRKAFPGEPDGTQVPPSARADALADLLLPTEHRHGERVTAA
ncbi:MAG: putative dependent oxidoreductase [Rhodospirillales bacterium]|jgi:NAD(P)-dependent dehydrogenase (short-subunit alcohol dehydrogenase family)|nr:putative dependent oxidoreductase [Rhodospirillales bacterium]